MLRNTLETVLLFNQMFHTALKYCKHGWTLEMMVGIRLLMYTRNFWTVPVIYELYILWKLIHVFVLKQLKYLATQHSIFDCYSKWRSSYDEDYAQPGSGKANTAVEYALPHVSFFQGGRWQCNHFLRRLQCHG